jgi:hypothetical protein
MPKTFQEEGLSFRYPDGWRLEREENDSGWTVLLQSPGTAFMTVTADGTLPTIEDMAETALEALRSDYPSLEAEEHVDTLAGQMAFGHDMRFFSLDLTNTCWTRCFYSGVGTVLVLAQASDIDLDQYEPALRAICASMRVEDET